MNNDKVQNFNATVDVGAAAMYTNAVSTFSAGTGGKESEVVVTTSDFTVTSSNGEVDKTVVVLSAPLLVQHALRN